MLIWNDRRIHTNHFLEGYEQLLLKYATDYQEVYHKNISWDEIASFSNPAAFKMTILEYSQVLSFEALQGSLLSSSYTPGAGNPNYEPMLNELWSLFDRYQVDESVRFEYDTLVYYGQLADPNMSGIPI